MHGLSSCLCPHHAKPGRKEKQLFLHSLGNWDPQAIFVLALAGLYLHQWPTHSGPEDVHLGELHKLYILVLKIHAYI